MVQQTSHPSKAWYHHLTLDLFVRVLSRSIFHPAIVLIFYLCIAALHRHRQAIAHYTLAWAAILAIVDVLLFLNRRITNGPPRNVQWDQEVVVITGGSSGLGRVLAETLVRRGAMVGILDVKKPDIEAEELMESNDLVWEVCDVTERIRVTKSIGAIKEKFGPPTILINNAAAPIHGKPLLPTLISSTDKQSQDPRALTPEDSSLTLNVNAISHFNLLSSCLPYMTTAANEGRGAHVVTISSVLSHLAPAYLADYAASKAAISTLHNSLKHEVATHPSANVRRNLKTLLVETGQMETGLFANMTNLPWYANFFGPVLDAKDIAAEIVRVLSRGDGGVIRMPFYASVIGSGWWGVLPDSVKKWVRRWAGIDRAMVGVEQKKRL